jgi:hypothetical protein
MDVHVPAAITEGLRRRRVDIRTCQDDGFRRADDDVLLKRATELTRILVTQDQDFLQIAAAWQQSGKRFTGIIFAPQQRASIGGYIADLELIANCAKAEELENLVTFLPLK